MEQIISFSMFQLRSLCDCMKVCTSVCVCVCVCVLSTTQKRSFFLLLLLMMLLLPSIGTLKSLIE